MPGKSVVRAVRKTLASLPAWPDLRVLDLSCGDGGLLEVLQAAGCRAEGTHFRRDDYIYRSPSPALAAVPVHEGVDLTRTIPLPAEQYDVVLATEVVEHLPCHSLFFAEAARILKPGGYFIFTTPNIHRLSSRMQFLLSGQHELRSARLGWHVPPAELYSTHHNPVYFPVAHTLLHHEGLRIRKLVFVKGRIVDFLLAPLYPVIAPATALEARHAIKRSRTGGADLLRWMLDFRLLFSNKLMVVTQKESSCAANDGGANEERNSDPAREKP
jgi:SAM-dependent methyltransferase